MAPRPEAAKAIEAILMVAQEPVDPHLLAQLLEVSQPIVEEICQQLAESYVQEERGFALAKVAGGYRFQSHADLAPYVERFALEGQSARLSAAALETLAIVAYKQPLSRAQVASIRGVNVDGVMRTLLQRGYLIEVGRDPGPGQATLFGTSSEFLERLGLDSLDDLPPINELFPSSEVMEALERGLRVEPEAPAASGSEEAPALPLDGEPEPVAERQDHELAAGSTTEPAEPSAGHEELDGLDDLGVPAWARDEPEVTNAEAGSAGSDGEDPPEGGSAGSSDAVGGP